MRVITPLDITSDTAFSRASTATYFDSTGTLQTAAIDVVRVNYDPETLEPEGILTEDAATNLLFRSQEFDNVYWVKTQTTISANSAVAPDGTLTMDGLVASAVNASHYIEFNLTSGVLSAQNTAESIYVKRGISQQVQFFCYGVGNWHQSFTFNFDTGAIIFSADSGGGQVTEDFGVQQINSDTWRLFISGYPDTSGTNRRFRLNYSNSSGSFTFAGDALSVGVYVWGAQLEIGDRHTSYIPTVATAVTRAADMLGDMVTSKVAEPDAGESSWNAATSYALNDVVIRTTTHKKYINIQAGVNATLPEIDAALDEPTRWIETGSTNRFAMFDTLRNTQTETTSPLSVVLVPGTRVNSIGILAMEAEEITITVSNGYEQIYTYTQNLNAREVLNWYDFFFEPFSNTPNIVKFDLPPYTAGNITITLKSSTGTVKCGAVIMGNYTDIGNLVYGARISANNFSRIDREFDGTAVLVQRQTKPKVSGTLFFDKAQTNKILALKSTLNAKPTVWSGLNDDNTDGYFDGLLILGIYKLFDVDIAYPEKAKLDIELEEI
jgi:hypothetical protein